MKIAVEGCCHGCLDRIYEVLSAVEEREGYKIDLLICCGDFQAVRNDEDLCCMAVPPKYREMETFYKYYSGEKKAPVLTLFIGGNHEASNHLWELSYGGWVAPNIYYLGNAGVVTFGGLRIAGLSGIYKPGDYNFSHYEQPPYNPSTMRSAYHVRSCDVFRLKQLSGHVDIMLSHDWPQGIYHYGNKEHLLRIKPHFGNDISRDCLGSPPAMDLLEKLKPTYWFSAHLHVKFAALYPHTNGHTKFLALDKCLPKRQFLQIIDIPTPSHVDDVTTPYRLEYDSEWLSILSLTEPLMKYSRDHWSSPSPLTHQRWQFTPTKEEIDTVLETFSDLTIPENFVAMVTPYTQGAKVNNQAVVVARENCQTTDFCKRLGFTNPFQPPNATENVNVKNPDEIELSDSETEDATAGEGMEVTDLEGKDEREKETIVGKTEEGVVWGVERRPGLHLPAPTANDGHVTVGVDVTFVKNPPEEEKDEGKHEEEVTEERSTNLDPEVKGSPEHSEEERRVKVRSGVVIKRRNQAMYEQEEEEEEEQGTN